MKLNKLIILGTTLAISLTFTACKEHGEEVISDPNVDGIQLQIGDIEDPITENPISEDAIDESLENENPVNEEEGSRFAEGAGEGIEHTDIKFADETFNTQFSDLTVRIEEGSISPTGLTVIYENSGDNEYHYGSSYYIEKNEDDKWTALPYLEEGEVMWTQVLYSVLSDQPSTLMINWETLYGTLSSGEYRIIKQITEVRGAEDSDLFFQGVGFTIE